MRIGKRIYFSNTPIDDGEGNLVDERTFFRSFMEKMETLCKDLPAEQKSTKMEMAISNKFNLDIIAASDVYEVYKQYIKYSKK